MRLFVVLNCQVILFKQFTSFKMTQTARTFFTIQPYKFLMHFLSAKSTLTSHFPAVILNFQSRFLSSDHFNSIHNNASSNHIFLLNTSIMIQASGFIWKGRYKRLMSVETSYGTKKE